MSSSFHFRVSVDDSTISNLEYFSASIQMLDGKKLLRSRFPNGYSLFWCNWFERSFSKDLAMLFSSPVAYLFYVYFNIICCCVWCGCDKQLEVESLHCMQRCDKMKMLDIVTAIAWGYDVRMLFVGSVEWEIESKRTSDRSLCVCVCVVHDQVVVFSLHPEMHLNASHGKMW